MCVHFGYILRYFQWGWDKAPNNQVTNLSQFQRNRKEYLLSDFKSVTGILSEMP